MKKALSLILALTLCLGLAVPALAATDNYGYRLGEYSLIGASEEPVGTQTFTHYFWGRETEALVFPAGTVISTVSANSSHKFIGCVYDITDVEYNAELIAQVKKGEAKLELPKAATKVRDFTLEPGALYEICVVYGEMQESVFVTTPAESVGTDDVYLLGDGTSTRMEPGVYWDAPFTGTSAETVLGKEVTVWHFPANAKIALDDWSYRVSMQVVSFSDEDGDGIKEEISYLSGDDIGTTPSTLGYADTVYIMEIYENGYDPDSDTYSSAFLKRYYIRLDEDPTVSAWAKEEISAARSARLIPDLTGAPSMQDAITREQFAELVVNFLSALRIGIDTYGKDTIRFTDCDNPAVLDAAIAGIVNGVGNNKFDPNATTNREQIATMLYRAIGYIKDIDDARGKDLAPKAGDIAKYTDKSAVSAWAVEGVGALAANGIMKGTSDTTLSPKNPCTVEQSIILIYRLYEAYFAD